MDLDFDRYASPKPLNPNLLFAGQYFDEESGLAYNRFRYYDPETACYLCSDPIGLSGGETPYSYVQNPWDWVDSFGLAQCSTILGKNLENAGIHRAPNMAAHHIIPVRDRYGLLKDAHSILKKYNIDINDARNGVFLPTSKNTNSSITGILHSGVHPKEYMRAINERIKTADLVGGKNAVLDELDKIKNLLSNATRILTGGNIL